METIRKALKKTCVTMEWLTHVKNGIAMVTDTKVLFQYPDNRADGVYDEGRLVNRPYPDVERVIPSSEPESSALIDVKETLAAIKYCAVLAKRYDKIETPVAWAFTSDAIVLSSHDDDGNKSSIEIEGLPIPLVPCQFVLSGAYVTLFLGLLKRRKITHCLVEYFKPGYPVLFTANEYRFLIMPIV